MEWLSDNAWSAWLAAAAVLGAAEMLGFDLTLVMVAVGALAGMVTALAGAPFALQAIVAAAAAAGMLAVVRPPIVKRLHSGPNLTLGTDKLVGRRGLTTTTVTGMTQGRIRIDGEEWTAAPYDEHLVIEPGQAIEVLQIRGATAYVHPVATLEP